MKTCLGVFFGGRSPEADVSVLTAMQVFSAIDFSKYDVVPVYMDGKWWSGDELMDVAAFRPFAPEGHVEVALVGNRLMKIKGKRLKEYKVLDCALICCHGGEGEGGSLQGALDLADVPYTSCGVVGSAICMDKILFKQVISALKIKAERGVAVSREEFAADRVAVLSKIVKRQGFPAIVKPSSLGSSIGVVRAKNREELCDALALCFALDERAVVEREIVRKCELNCAAVRYDGDIFVSAVEKPKQVDGVLTFEDKYVDGAKGSQQRELPANIPAELSEKVRATTLKLYSALNLSGVVRVDYLFDLDKSELYVNEINTVPGSMAFYMFKPCGIEFSTLIDMMVEEARVKHGRERRDFSEFRRGNILSANIIK